jgi:hypothetical protein
VGVQPQNSPRSVREAFTHQMTHPLALNLIMIKEFGPEYLGWEPETCWIEIQRTWGASISELNRNKLQAIRTCHTSNQPYERWEVFDSVAVGLMGMPPRFDLIQKPSPHRAAVAIDIMQQVKEGETISPEIYKYIAAAFLDYGLAYAPDPLGPCNTYLTKFVSQQQQSRVKSALARNRKPSFDGTNEDDIQIMKCLSVKDFTEFFSRELLLQLKNLL